METLRLEELPLVEHLLPSQLMRLKSKKSMAAFDRGGEYAEDDEI